MIEKNKVLEALYKHNYWSKPVSDMGYSRPWYLEQLQSFLGNTLVKVIIGQRRCGKSRLLKMMINHLVSSLDIQPENILYINKELLDFDFIVDYKDLLETIAVYQEALHPSGKGYIFLDEVHEISGWEKVVNSLAQDAQVPVELFITGSNANLLSGELATWLGGRYLELTVYPFGYEEYLNAFQLKRSRDSVLQYLQVGGMPELYQLQNEDVRRNYMESLVDSIVLRDIIQRNNIRDVFLLRKIIHFLSDTAGSMVSIASIIKTLKQQGYKSNVETIGNYVDFCKNAFFVHECQRYDLRGKQILTGERKYYLNDLAFKTVFNSGFDLSIGRVLENAVYLSLLRQGYSVYVGRYFDREIDFVAERGQEKIYIQVAYVLPDDNVIKREFGNLLLIKDNYPKWVITMDDFSIGNVQGVLHKSIWDVLN